MKNCPVQIGDKVVVFGSVCEQFRPIVSDVTWLPHESRWEIELIWEFDEISRVYCTDQGKYWATEKEYNKSNLLLN